MTKQKADNTQNIFEELGFDSDEAENLKVRSDMMIAIKRVIRERGLKQVAAAELFGTTQPRISMLLKGRIDEFTMDTLWNMLHHAGIRAEIHIPVETA